MTHLPWAYSDPIDGEGMDDEDRGAGEPFGPYCEHCGQELDWEDCGQCEDGQIDAYELDPMWYDPGDTEDCTMCGGKGGWHSCSNQACPGKRDVS